MWESFVKVVDIKVLFLIFIYLRILIKAMRTHGSWMYFAHLSVYELGKAVRSAM